MFDFLNLLMSEATGAIDGADLGAFVSLLTIAALLEIGIPFPFVLDTVLFYLGYQRMGAWSEIGAVMGVLLAGRLLGSSIVYWVARGVGGRLVVWFGSERNVF